MTTTPDRIEATVNALEGLKDKLKSGREGARCIDGMIAALRGSSPAGLRAHAARLDSAEAHYFASTEYATRKAAGAAIAFSRKWDAELAA